MKMPLLWKLVAIQIPVIIGVIALIWISIDYLAADYFMTLMTRFQIEPAETNGMFLAAIHRYLIWTSAGALCLAVGTSYMLTRRVLDPLSRMIRTTEQIAAGDYSARSRAESNDELGALARSIDHMASALQRVEQLRRTLVADAAHELRTPLTNVRGYLEAMRDQVLEPSPERIDMLHREVLRLVALVDSLFELARAESSSITLNPSPVALHNSIERALQSHARQIEQRNLEVDVKIAPDASRLLADPARLAQILHNLVDNAVAYAPAGGKIGIEAERVNGSVRVQFSNGGEPIAEEDLPFIFERFFRGDKSRSRDTGGAGIGLSIVRELVTAHGGELGASSDANATRIWFSVPCGSLSDL